MALGGGRYTIQNKELPGVYSNYSSSVIASSLLSERGVAAFGMFLDWGEEGKLLKITKEDFQKNTRTLFGYEYEDDEMEPLRNYFQQSIIAFIYRFKGNSTNTKNAAASNDFVTAKYPGKCGNNIAIEIVKDDLKYFVKTYYNDVLMETQEVEAYNELKNNDYVLFNKSGTTLKALEKENLKNGSSITTTTIADHQQFLTYCESKSFNVLGCISNTKDIKEQYIAATKRMREEMGLNFQTIIYWDPSTTGNNPETQPDHEGIILAYYTTVDNSQILYPMYTIIGDCAGVPLSRNLTNYTYSGTTEINTNYSQTELESNVKKGFFMLHQVGEEVHYLEDINSLTSFTEKLNKKFRGNKIIRVIDSINTYIASIYSKNFIGVLPNIDETRAIFKLAVLNYLEDLEADGVLENVTADDITVEEGESEESVVLTATIKITGVMEQLYMESIIK